MIFLLAFLCAATISWVTPIKAHFPERPEEAFGGMIEGSYEYHYLKQHLPKYLSDRMKNNLKVAEANNQLLPLNIVGKDGILSKALEKSFFNNIFGNKTYQTYSKFNRYQTAINELCLANTVTEVSTTSIEAVADFFSACQDAAQNNDKKSIDFPAAILELVITSEIRPLTHEKMYKKDILEQMLIRIDQTGEKNEPVFSYLAKNRRILRVITASLLMFACSAQQLQFITLTKLATITTCMLCGTAYCLGEQWISKRVENHTAYLRRKKTIEQTLQTGS